MIQWILYFWRLCIFKALPDQAPPTRTVFYLSVLSYWALASFFASLSQTLLPSLFLSLVETALLIFMTNISLWIRNMPERATQTLTALFGSGSILILLSILILSNFTISANETSNVFFIVSMIFLVWNVLIYGNIFKASLSLPYIAGVGIALIFIYLTFTITWRFLKVISISQM